MAMLAALALALQIDAPTAVADTIRRVLLLADPKAALLQTVRKTRSQRSFEAAFDGAGGPAGMPIGKKGTGRRCAPGILLLDVETAGGKKTQAVRVAHRTWVYGSVTGTWMAPDEAGEAGVAHGLTNPDDLLSLVAAHAALARFKGADLEVVVPGARAVAAANMLAPNQNWMNAQVGLLLTRDSRGRIASIDVDARVANAQGAATLTARFRIGRYGEVEVPDRMGKVAFSQAIRNAIDAHLRR